MASKVVESKSEETSWKSDFVGCEASNPSEYFEYSTPAKQDIITAFVVGENTVYPESSVAWRKVGYKSINDIINSKPSTFSDVQFGKPPQSDHYISGVKEYNLGVNEYINSIVIYFGGQRNAIRGYIFITNSGNRIEIGSIENPNWKHKKIMPPATEDSDFALCAIHGNGGFIIDTNAFSFIKIKRSEHTLALKRSRSVINAAAKSDEIPQNFTKQLQLRSKSQLIDIIVRMRKEMNALRNQLMSGELSTVDTSKLPSLEEMDVILNEIDKENTTVSSNNAQIDSEDTKESVTESEEDELDFNGMSDSEIHRYVTDALFGYQNRTVRKAIQLMEEVRGKFDVNFANEENYTLLMGCAITNNTEAASYLLNNYQCDTAILNKYNQTALDIARDKGSWKVAQIILTSAVNLELKEKMEKLQSNRMKLKGITRVFMSRFRQRCDDIKKTNPQIYELTMQLLEDTLIDTMKERKSMSQDLLFIVWEYHLAKGTQKQFWTKIQSEITTVLNINTLYKNVIDWGWFQLHLLDSPIWLEEIEPKKLLFDSLMSIINVQLGKQKVSLNTDMTALVKQSPTVWNDLTALSYVNPNYRSPFAFRQDYCVNGLVSEYSWDDLQLFSGQFRADALYDFSTYLSKLLIRAHVIHPHYQKTMLSIFSDMIQTGQIQFSSGPVKTHARSSAKAEIDYPRNKNYVFPSSAHIIDILRCSVACPTLAALYESVQRIFNLVNKSTLSRSSDDNQCILVEILRIKNGFGHFATISDPQTPDFSDGYRDIKLNVVVSYRGESVVTEVQFMLKPMMDVKKTGHQLYEVQRLSDLVRNAHQILEMNSVEAQLQRIFDTDDVSKFAELVICDLFHINDKTEINRRDVSGYSPVMRAIVRDASKVLRFLCTAKDNIEWTLKTTGDGSSILHMAANCLTKPAVFEWFVTEALPKEHVQTMVNAQDSARGVTPIMVALQSGETKENMKILLRQFHSSVNFSQTDSDGDSIMHYACRYITKESDFEWFITQPFMKEYIIDSINTPNLWMNQTPLVYISEANRAILQKHFPKLLSTLSQPKSNGLKWGQRGPIDVELVKEGIKVTGKDVRTFPSITVNTPLLTSGKWYFEAHLQTDTLMQFGWATPKCKPEPYEGMGVGDNVESWSYDGYRLQKWHNGRQSYGDGRWKSGDVIGCAIDIENKTMQYWINDSDLGIAFENFETNDGFYAAASVAHTNQVTIIFDAEFMKRKLPSGFKSLGEA